MKSFVFIFAYNITFNAQKQMKRLLFLCVFMATTLCAVAQQAIVWEHPNMPYTPASNRISVTRVELSPAETDVTFLLKAPEGVKVWFSKDCKRKIRIGRQKPVLCGRIISEKMPDYPIADNNAEIKDNNYQSGDSVTLIGWLKDMPADLRDKGKELAVMNYSVFANNGDAVIYSAPLDSIGRFSLRLPVENACCVIGDYRRSGLLLILEPGETYYIMHDFATHQQFVMGGNARLQNEMLAYVPNIKFPSTGDVKRIGTDAFLAKCDSIRQSGEQQITDMAAEHKLSARWQHVNRNQMSAGAAFTILQSQYGQSEMPDKFIACAEENMRSFSLPYTLCFHLFTTIQHDYGQIIARKPAVCRGALSQRGPLPNIQTR